MELSFYSLDSSNLTKAQLAEILFEQLGLNKREAKDFIDAFFEIISAQLADG
jgi:integration host factor subunit alpha